MAEMNNIVSGANIYINTQRKIVSMSNNSNGQTQTSEANCLPVSVEMEDNNKEAGDLLHPSINGWFAEHCPIWPGDEWDS